MMTAAIITPTIWTKAVICCNVIKYLIKCAGGWEKGAAARVDHPKRYRNWGRRGGLFQFANARRVGFGGKDFAHVELAGDNRFNFKFNFFER